MNSITNGKWQMPNCLGSFDGKHIPIVKPANASSDFFNFKRFHSIILMAVADASYKFISIDVGKQKIILYVLLSIAAPINFFF